MQLVACVFDLIAMFVDGARTTLSHHPVLTHLLAYLLACLLAHLLTCSLVYNTNLLLTHLNVEQARDQTWPSSSDPNSNPHPNPSQAQDLAELIGCIADIFTCSVGGCMGAQVLAYTYLLM